MNAEVFEKKEYADSVARVDFIRIKDLSVGQLYFYQSTWRVVSKKVLTGKNKGIYSKYQSGKPIDEPFGLNNRMFVQVAK